MANSFPGARERGGPDRRPRSSISPPSARSAPKRMRTVSVRPEPMRPASPRISPPHSSKPTSRSAFPRRRPRTRRTGSRLSRPLRVDGRADAGVASHHELHQLRDRSPPPVRGWPPSARRGGRSRDRRDGGPPRAGARRRGPRHPPPSAARSRRTGARPRAPSARPWARRGSAHGTARARAAATASICRWPMPRLATVRSGSSVLEADAGEDRSRALAQRSPVDEAEAVRPSADEHLLGDGERVHEVQLLEHDRHPARRGLGLAPQARRPLPPAASSPHPASTRPARIRDSVLLPAPFSPTRAWTSPPRRSSEASTRAGAE